MKHTRSMGNNIVHNAPCAVNKGVGKCSSVEEGVDTKKPCVVKILLRNNPSFLKEPVMTKVTERGEAKVTLFAPPSYGREGHEGDGNSKLQYAVSEMQGWRSHMEDAHVLNPNLASNTQQTMLIKDHHLFAVFDGHGGNFASKFCGKHLVSTLTAQKDWQAYLTLSSERHKSSDSVKGLKLLKSALTSTFLELDTKLIEAQRKIRLSQLSELESLVNHLQLDGDLAHPIFLNGTQEHEKIMNFDRQFPSLLPPGVNLERSGSTGVVVLITPSHIICANAGDSRAILSKKNKVLPLSFDHKPSNDVELTRVEKDGGFVRAGRVDGDLAVSRSFGDFGYKFGNAAKSGRTSSEAKDHRVTVHPDILVYAREPSNDEFLVLACDGIWDRLSNKQCSDLVHSLVYCEGETDVGLICEEMIDTALELDSLDNMTCCIVMFPGVNMAVADHLAMSTRSKLGVMKRRLDRETIWGEHSTPAKRHRKRWEEHRIQCEDRRMKTQALQQAKTPESQPHTAAGKKHKASKSSINGRSRHGKSLALNQI
jgi:serine/threonine protein phosphatase PrpC